MTAENWCSRSVVTAMPQDSVLEVARAMRQKHVGGIVVVEKTDLGDVPVGMITDRDITLECVAGHRDPATLPVGDIMSDEIITHREDDDVDEVLETMMSTGVRRMPLVDMDGHLRGMVTLDDLLEVMTREGRVALSALPRLQRNWEREVRRG
jgi:CBS domain-containing protein